MHYFKFNIKDYHYATRHFNFVEHGAYLHLMTLYYETEKPLTTDIDELAKLCMTKSEEEINAIKRILENFFIKTEDGYVQRRAATELEKYKENNGKKSMASHIRWGKYREKKAEEQQEQVAEEELNQGHVSKPLDVNISIWEDYMHFRKLQKKPLYETTLKSIRKEAVQAGINLNQAITVCLENNWINFKAQWYQELKSKTKESEPMRLPGK